MREIKFRAKNKNNNEWFYWKVEDPFMCDWGHYLDETKNVIIDWHTLGQYTGLKGKNGKEIYEGDICKAAKPFICSISIDLYDGIIMTWAFSNARSKLMGNMAEPIWRNHEISLEIIGNIHENPELLEE